MNLQKQYSHARKMTDMPSSGISTKLKLQPSQSRSQGTVELIIETTGRLLEKIGFDRLSTNMVCKEADLSPPALYRYFPNKYALLRELGDRLMAAQDELLFAWIDEGLLYHQTTEQGIANNYILQKRIMLATQKFPGNVAIMRALRAVPILRPVRVASREAIAERLARIMQDTMPGVPLERLIVGCRITTEWSYAATELVVEEPERDAEETLWEVARGTTEYFEALARAGLTGEFGAE